MTWPYQARRNIPTDQYKLVSRVFKNPLSIQQINSHIRLIVATGNLYIGTLSGNEYTLDAREYGGSNATDYTALRIRFIPDTTNDSGSITVKIGSLGSIALKKADGSNFAVGELKTNVIYTFDYTAGSPALFLQNSILTDNENEFDYYFYMGMSILEWAEKFMKKDIFAKTYDLLTTDFSGEKELRRSPYFSFTSFKYLKSGVWTDIDPATYQIVESDNYSKIAFLPYNYFPKDVDDQEQNTKIRFTTKMFDSISKINSDIKQAFVLVMASLNQYRGDCIESFNAEAFNIYSNLPPAAQMILRSYRLESIW